ncbi:peptide chain release factor N(5)-glutamine methyltransferase [Tindallia californiensis]|uniref:Release factor glutamine methyltransferase n=1 Tax=Tindallia californiensis TaxID=159292 RepID=A0A1H3LIN8_9FIRM|nr:peptide chain release factor N(5)-glutamine methyltransferase [Tindallia californiensis]SDY63828.1 release factor glutamine methyltransferase [Tindallia californiensis]
MTRIEWIRWAVNELKQSEVQTPILDAEVLMAHLLKVERIQLHMYPELEVDQRTGEEFAELIQRRKQQCPVAYLTEEQEFMGLSFRVTPAVLIPRPDTEILVEAILKWVKNHQKKDLLLADIGTGSGAIAISLAHFEPELQIIATDISQEALEIARNNAKQQQVDHQITFLFGDMIEPIKAQGKKLDAIVSNPPYITQEEMKSLPLSVIGYEPKMALDGGTDGLAPYRIILEEALELLKPGALLAFEMGWKQGEALQILMEQAGLENVRILKDLAGKDRTVIGFKKNWQS